MSFPGFVLACAALVIACVGGLAESLQFDRDALTHGQLWRLWTGHLAHWSANHLAWDALTLIVLTSVLPPSLRRHLGSSFALSAFLISVGVFFIHPELETYRGLSGLACVPFGMLVTWQLMRQDALAMRAVAGAFAVGFMLKTGVEFTGRGIFVDDTSACFVTVPLAHLVGAAIGSIRAIRTKPVDFA